MATNTTVTPTMATTAALTERATWLRNTISRHEHLYYVKATPEISDREFDALMAELQELETKYPELLRADSPTQRVGGIAESFATIAHRIPMLSIENSYSYGDIRAWLERLQKIVGHSVFPLSGELKIDGVSATLQYHSGSFVAGATRGDGQTGDEVTANLKTIRTLPLTIENRQDMDIRGEVYVPHARLLELNRKRLAAGEEPFKNCRNLAAGTLKSLNPAVVAERGLQLVVYGIAQAHDLGFIRHSEVLEFLAQQGFAVNPLTRVCEDFAAIEAFIAEVNAKRHHLPFDIDGLVFKVDTLALHEKLGQTAKSPRWCIAYKFAQEQAITRLQSVGWQVGRLQITPVAHLEPVELGGTTVARASLHNIEQIREKDIRTGDLVVVEKAGYIIPYVVKALSEARTGNEQQIEPPQVCPSCGQPLQTGRQGALFDTSEQTTTALHCDNPSCQGIISRRILYFVGQTGIENLGPQLIDSLLTGGFVADISDLFRLSREDLLQVERLGERSATKILENIAQARTVPLGKLVAALGIPNVGTVVGKSIAEAVDGDFRAFRAISSPTLLAIKGIKERVAGNVSSFLGDPANQELLDSLEEWWLGPAATKAETAEVEQSLAGKSLVVTGEAIVPRRKLTDLITRYGGQVKAGVTATTAYLVIGSQETPEFTSTKKQKAQQLGIQIINEQQLFQLLGVSVQDI